MVYDHAESQRVLGEDEALNTNAPRAEAPGAFSHRLSKPHGSVSTAAQ